MTYCPAIRPIRVSGIFVPQIITWKRFIDTSMTTIPPGSETIGHKIGIGSSMTVGRAAARERRWADRRREEQ